MSVPREVPIVGPTCATWSIMGNRAHAFPCRPLKNLIRMPRHETTPVSQASALIACIVVLYQPDLDAFESVINSIKDQADTVFIVDNSTSDHSQDIELSKNVQYIPLWKNVGIAAAQNIGIQKALQLKHTHVWLSDQDTIYPENFRNTMLAILAEQQSLHSDIAALAPAYFDITKDALQPFCRHTPFSNYFLPHPGINRVAHSIASGMLIPAAVLEIVGTMQAELFIDAVDLEWCWRAKNKFGYQTLGTGDVTIHHRMGDRYVKFFNRKVGFRTPLRHYYMIRNAVHLALHSSSATTAIRLEVFIKAFLWMLIFPAIAPIAKGAHLKATTAGFIDGARNRMGPRAS